MRFQNEKKSRGSKVMASQSLKSSKKCMYEERIITSFLFCSAVSNPIRLQLSEKLDSDICDVLQRWGFHFSLRSKKKARVTRAKGRVLGSLKISLVSDVARLLLSRFESDSPATFRKAGQWYLWCVAALRFPLFVEIKKKGTRDTCKRACFGVSENRV